MKRPTLEKSRNIWLNSSINTNESAYSLYSKEQDKFIASILVKNIRMYAALKKCNNVFIGAIHIDDADMVNELESLLKQMSNGNK